MKTPKSVWDFNAVTTQPVSLLGHTFPAGTEVTIERKPGDAYGPGKRFNAYFGWKLGCLLREDQFQLIA